MKTCDICGGAVVRVRFAGSTEVYAHQQPSIDHIARVSAARSGRVDPPLPARSSTHRLARGVDL